MTPEQTLIQQISQMIENGMLERNALLDEYAVQYSELCHSVNTRLLQCANYLEKGLLSEAVYIARQQPDLLEAVALVQFPLAKKWQNICMDLELTVPPLLHTEIVEKLQDASRREEELRPLLQEFRKYTYQREHRPALEVLRKIRRLDPENQSWTDNLRQLEEEELPLWLERLDKALKANDLTELKLIEAEFRHPQRVAQVPEDCLQKLDRSLLQEHQEDLLREAEEIMEDMRRHLEADSENGVRSLLERIVILEQNEAFLSRPEHWSRMKEEAGEFLRKQDDRRAAGKLHQEEEKKFQKMLEAGRASDLELRQAMQRLEKSEFPVSDLLRRQMEEIIAERRRMRLLKLRSSFGILLLVLIVLLGAAAFWFGFTYRNKVYKKRLVQIENLIQQKNYQEAERFLAGFKSDYPGRLQDEDVLQLIADLEKGQKKQAENLKLTEALWSEMQLAQKDDFNITDAQAAAWLERAAVLNWTPEEKITLENWRSAWLREKKNRQQESNAQVRQAVQKSGNFISYHKGDTPDAELIREIGVLLEELRLVRSRAIHVEEGLRLALEQRIDALMAWQEDAGRKLQAAAVEEKKRKEKLDALTGMRNRLESRIQPGNLNFYFRSLEELVRLGGTEMALRYGPILGREKQQNSAFLMNRYSYLTMPLKPSVAGELQKVLEQHGRNTVWESELMRILAEHKHQREASESLAAALLEQQEQYLLYRLEYRRKGTEEWRPLYMPQMLKSREEKIASGGRRSAGQEEMQKYRLYWGNVYYWEKDEDEPVLVHSSTVFANGLNTREYEIRNISPRSEDQLCPHGRFLIQMVADSAGAADPGDFLLRKLMEIDKAAGFEPIPRFWLKKRLVLYLSERIYPENLVLKKLAHDYEAIDTRVPWMNRRHPKTAVTEQKVIAAGRLLPDIHDLLRKIALQRSISARSLGLIPRCIGALQPDEEGNLHLPDIVPEEELLVLIPSPAAGSEIWMQLASDGGEVRPEVLRQCVPGQPVFAVRESCRAWLEKHVQVSQEEWKTLRRPGCWPVNAWIYPGRKN